MSQRITALALLLGASTAWCVPAPPPEPAARSEPSAAAGFSASAPRRVERVVDGDTLVLDHGLRVRLLGIDTPEMRHESPVVRELARAARLELERLVEGRLVVLEVGTPSTDRYGRVLAYVLLPAGGSDEADDVGALLLSSGHAQVFPAAHPRREQYRSLQRRAREEGRGLWAASGREALGLVVVAEVDAVGAAASVGRRVRVTDVVKGARLNEHGLFAELGSTSPLRVVVFASQLPLFPDDVASRWRGKRLAITGTVELHRGRPEIVVEDPDQVEILAP